MRMADQAALLVLANVSQQFGGIAALSNIYLTIEGNSVLGLVGPNGAGKSTLLEVIAGFQKPDTGCLFFNGVRINELRPDQHCAMGICRTFQSVEVFSDLTVFENALIGAFVNCGSRREAEEIATSVLEQVSLLSNAHWPAKMLNQGQLKRLDLARALSTRPKLLLLDEVMAGLDTADIAEVSALIKQLSKLNITIVIVEHNLSIIKKLATRVVVLDHGHLILDGSPFDVFRDPKIIDLYVGRH